MNSRPIQLDDYVDQTRAALVHAGMLFVAIGSCVSAILIALSSTGSIDHYIHGGAVGLGGLIALLLFAADQRNPNSARHSNANLFILVLAIYIPNLVGDYLFPSGDHERTFILVGVLFGVTYMCYWRFLAVYVCLLVTWCIIGVQVGRTPTYADWFYLAFLVPVFGLIGGNALYTHLQHVFQLHRDLTTRADDLAQTERHLRVEKQLREAEEQKRQQSEQIIQQQEEQLRHVTRATTMGEMVASIAHEINQPLNAMGMCSGLLLLDNVAEPERRNAARQVNSLVKRCGAIIQRLRNFVKRDTTSETEVCLRQVIQDSIALVANEAKRHNVRLDFAFDATMQSETVVMGNEIELQQVMVNLLQNAIEAMHIANAQESGVTINLSRKSDTLVVSVQDQGLGLDTRIHDELFEPFKTTKPSGMGMGLAICRSILDRHNGSISASNNKGKGATFRFSLPRAKPNQKLKPPTISTEKLSVETTSIN